MGCSPILECVQPGLTGTSTIIMVCFCSLAGERDGGAGDYDCYIFSWKNKKFHQFDLSAKEMKVVADVGCRRRLPAPPAQQPRTDAVFPVYISISIYIYIYMLSLPSLSSVTVRRSWDVGGVGESRMKAPS